jgi:hypothetical protein
LQRSIDFVCSCCSELWCFLEVCWPALSVWLLCVFHLSLLLCDCYFWFWFCFDV